MNKNHLVMHYQSNHTIEIDIVREKLRVYTELYSYGTLYFSTPTPGTMVSCHSYAHISHAHTERSF